MNQQTFKLGGIKFINFPAKYMKNTLVQIYTSGKKKQCIFKIAV